MGYVYIEFEGKIRQAAIFIVTFAVIAITDFAIVVIWYICWRNTAGYQSAVIEKQKAKMAAASNKLRG